MESGIDRCQCDLDPRSIKPMIVMNLEVTNRTGESGPIPNRGERFFQLNNDWFFATREGSMVGPYSTRDSASIGLGDYLDFLKLSKPRVRKLLLNAYSTKDQSIKNKTTH